MKPYDHVSWLNPSNGFEQSPNRSTLMALWLHDGKCWPTSLSRCTFVDVIQYPLKWVNYLCFSRILHRLHLSIFLEVANIYMYIHVYVCIYIYIYIISTHTWHVSIIIYIHTPSNPANAYGFAWTQDTPNSHGWP